MGPVLYRAVSTARRAVDLERDLPLHAAGASMEPWSLRVILGSLILLRSSFEI